MLKPAKTVRILDVPTRANDRFGEVMERALHFGYGAYQAAALGRVGRVRSQVRLWPSAV